MRFFHFPKLDPFGTKSRCRSTIDEIYFSYWHTNHNYCRGPIRFKYKPRYQNYYRLELQQTRNVLLLIFITIILAIVSSVILYVLDHFLTILLTNFEYASRIPDTFNPLVRWWESYIMLIWIMIHCILWILKIVKNLTLWVFFMLFAILKKWGDRVGYKKLIFYHLNLWLTIPILCVWCVWSFQKYWILIQNM